MITVTMFCFGQLVIATETTGKFHSLYKYGYSIMSLRMSPSFTQHGFDCSLINLSNTVLD
jgi:hypothetical protein